MKTKYFLVLLFLLAIQVAFAQDMNGIVQNHLNKIQARAELAQLDKPEWKISDVVPSLNPEIQHVYLRQYYQGIEIDGAGYKLTVKNNEVTWEIDQFVKNAKSKVVATRGTLSPENAILNVVRAHNLATPKLVSASRVIDGVMQFTGSGITIDDKAIKVKRVYQIDKTEDKLRLAWNVSIYQKDGQHWWNENVDAISGKILSSEDWVISCHFGVDNTNHETHNHDSFSLFNNTDKAIGPTEAFRAGSYNVYAMPTESPNHGGRSSVSNPDNALASPFGWHDTNGSNGAEFTTTRGNNVTAQDDSNGNNGTGFQPDGGAALNFNFPINLNQAPSSYRSAAITNLFYWNNIMHDVWYQYGFNESSGNFQENNYGRGGIGSDSVNADAQDGSGTNNANFATPPDGSNPRMQMFLFTNPTRDGDLDNVIIAHEYGHGISTRLVGGPSANRLGGSEQMGEGWSDWFGLMLTMRAGDTGAKRRGVGTFAIGEPTTGDGIRPTVYSTDRSLNNTDYADVNTLVAPHGVGYGFATILWDMTWALIDEEGFSSNFYTGNGGNNIAMALVIEGLKNTANNPGYVSGRDGILQADQDLYGGKYNCLIWTVFSERGVGLNANENNNGGTNGKTDQTVSFVNGCSDDPTDGDCSGNVSSFPYNESFEGNLGLWQQATADDLNWTIDSNGTPSSGTGPSSATDGNSYIYLEVSGNGQGYPNKRGILNSPCINLSSVNAPRLKFNYHMIGNAVGNLTIEARVNNSGNWTSIFSRTGAQGNGWNQADISLSAYEGQSSVQLRINAVSGTSWQGDIAIDALSISGTADNPDCGQIDFSSTQITSFSNQDSNGAFQVTGGGTGLTLTNNTWKQIPLNYTITANTVLQFDFRSTSQGEIHGVGFEDDNALTAELYFKVHGTQNYGNTNFDNYSGSATRTYTIPVGNFYTGNTDRMVFINDNDGGSGNNSFFSNVRVYEGSCNGSLSVEEVIAQLDNKASLLGDEDEGIGTVKMTPNPTSDLFTLNISSVSTEEIILSIYTILGQKKYEGQLNSGVNNFSARSLSLSTGVYIVKIQSEGNQEVIKKLIVK